MAKGKLIGLCGKAGSGKDYVYDGLAEIISAERVAFADEVRAEVAEALTASPEEVRFLWEKPYPDELRSLLQWWGTEYRRAQDEMYWVKKTRPIIEDALNYYDLVVVTDVRYRNEAALIKYLGGMVVEVHTIEPIRLERLGGNNTPEHASEVIDFPVDAWIHNDDVPILPEVVQEYLGIQQRYLYMEA